LPLSTDDLDASTCASRKAVDASIIEA